MSKRYIKLPDGSIIEADGAPVDSSLSIGGAAADAAVVGEKFTELSEEIADKLDANKLPEAINTALAQAKASGEFNGEPGAPGNDYVLTKADKTEIAEQAAGLIDTALLTIIGSGVTA